MGPQRQVDEKRRRRALKAFDRFAARDSRKLEARYGKEFADETLGHARVELERLWPEIPYIGGLRNAFTPVMIVNGWGIALHRAMAARGKTAADTIRICAAVSDEFVGSAGNYSQVLRPSRVQPILEALL